ncbi:MAG: DUF2865 domain-containing protein [Sphingomonadales bacterium]|nr:DUF2865 domain-containing protein [Sphingomonadales bacterium]
MVLRFLQRWRVAPRGAVISIAAYAFVILSLFALAAQATGRLAGMVAQLAPALIASSKPGAKSADARPAASQKAVSAPQTRARGSVVLTQGWSGYSGYSRDRSYWRERGRSRESWRGHDRDEDDDWRWRDSDEDRENDPAQNYSSTYRTVCVRLCDGYYWPMSYATTQAGFERERQKCESSCGSPARLYRGRTGSEIDDMEDQNGQPYRRLKNAFLYRTQYDAACRCKPEPWSKEATDRHKMYALEAARAKGDKVAAQQLKEMKAAQEAERRQAVAAARNTAGMSSAVAANGATESADGSIDADTAANARRPPPNNERMSLGARPAPASSGSSVRPARIWQRQSDFAP